MPYASTTGVDTTVPDGAVVNADQIDENIRAIKADFIERIDDILGTDFENEDPVVVKTLKLNGQAATKVLIGSTSTTFRDDADSADILRLTETAVETGQEVDFKDGSKTTAGLHSARRHTQTGGTINWANGNIQRTLLSSNTTISFSNQVVGSILILEILQNGTGGHTVTFPAGVAWGGGSAPTVTTAGNRKDVFGFICVAAAAFLGFVLDQNFANTD